MYYFYKVESITWQLHLPNNMQMQSLDTADA